MAAIWEPKIAIEMDGDVPDMCLPPGWIAVYHKCGGIVYLDKETRVVTWSRPYMLSKDSSLRKHDIPVVAIPCLHQMLAPRPDKKSSKRKLDNTSNLETFSKKIKLNNLNESIVEEGEVNEQQHDKDMENEDIAVDCVSSRSLHSYLQKIYNFKVVADEESKLPVFTDTPSINKDQMLMINSPKLTPKKFTVEGKTPKQILHEYVQKYIKLNIEYKKLDANWQKDRMDLFVEVVIGDISYAIGCGGTMKIAMQEAASATLNILDPLLQPSENENYTHLEEFDKLLVDDEQVYDKVKDCKHRGVYTPFEALLKLMKRYVSPGRFCERDISCQVNHPANEGDKFTFKMKYKDYEITGSHSNKNCKHLASQFLIKKLYPSIKSWGSVVRLAKVKWQQVESSSPMATTNVSIGNSPFKSPQGSSPSVNRGSLLVEKLKNEMRKMN